MESVTEYLLFQEAKPKFLNEHMEPCSNVQVYHVQKTKKNLLSFTNTE